MTVPSWQFIIFVIITAEVYNLSAAAWWRSSVLFVVNVCFLLTFTQDPLAFLPFGLFLCLGYAGVVLMQIGWVRLFPFFIVLTLLCFVWLKRYGFIPSDLLLPAGYLTVGLSYVFFRVMHLIIDARDRTLPCRIGPLSYFNYTLDFTCLTSGPIQRYQDYHRMTATERLPLDKVIVVVALERIVLGFFKVAIVSAVLIWMQNTEINALTTDTQWTVRVANGILVAAIYPIYLFANFSGYTDVVIGSARLFRIQLPENFDRPFSSENFITFWGRWHITLSNWLKTYIFTPLLLVLMRRNPSSAAEPFFGAFAYFVTFFMVGIWHGQTSEFLFFGLLQGGGVAANKLYQVLLQRLLGRKDYSELCRREVYRSLARGLTFTWFTFSLLWFWSNWTDLAKFADNLGVAGAIAVWAAIFIAATLILAAIEMSRARLISITVGGEPLVNSRYVRSAAAMVMVLFIAFDLVILNMPLPAIVYKTF